VLVFFSSCVPTNDDVKSVFQTNLANAINDDSKDLQRLLVKFKEKLDKRNPNGFSKKLAPKINRTIKSENKKLYLRYKDSILENYKDYLQIAFSKDEIYPRNDYLVLGLYYLIDSSYEMDDGHRITALQYDKEKLNKLYKNLQIIKWKIKVDKDFKENYLFLTWQNNWQIELEKKVKNNEKLSLDEIKMLEAIKEKKETMFDSSNFSFEVILTQMLGRVGDSLKALGEEPQELRISALRSIFLFL
jgi:hypothetical protein